MLTALVPILTAVWVITASGSADSAAPPAAQPAAAPPAAAPPAAALPAAAPPAAAPAEKAAEETTKEKAPELPKLLVLDVRGSDIDKAQSATLTDVVAARAQRFGQVDVISSGDVRALSDVMAAKVNAGCDEDACMTELAGALNAQWVLLARVGKLGSRTVSTMQLFDAHESKASGRDTAETYSVEELPAQLSTLTDTLLERALGAPVTRARESTADEEQEAVFEIPAPPAREPGMQTSTMLMVGGGAGIGVGVLAFGVGVLPAALYGAAKSDLTSQTRAYDGDPKALEKAAKTQDDARFYRNVYNTPGRILAISGLVLAVAGGAALAAGFLLPAPDEQTAAPGVKP